MRVPEHKTRTRRRQKKAPPRHFRCRAETLKSAAYGARRRRPTGGLVSRVSSLDFFCLGPFFTGHDLKNDFVALVEGLEAFSENRGVMDKHILAHFLSNEPEALFIVPPFDFAFSHNYLLNVTEGVRTKKQTDTHLTWVRARLTTGTAYASEWPAGYRVAGDSSSVV